VYENDEGVEAVAEAEEEAENRDTEPLTFEMQFLVGLSATLAVLPICCGLLVSCWRRRWHTFKRNCLIGEGCGCECCACCFSEKTRNRVLEKEEGDDPVKLLESFVGPLEGRAEGTRIGGRSTRVVELGPRGSPERRQRKKDQEMDLRSWQAGGSTRDGGIRRDASSRRAARGKFAGARFGVSAEAGATAAGAGADAVERGEAGGRGGGRLSPTETTTRTPASISGARDAGFGGRVQEKMSARRTRFLEESSDMGTRRVS
jgi:hypothetical protein